MWTAPYYCVVDLEATCCDRGTIPRGDSETIEIGAVLIDGASLRTVAELQAFVTPVVHPLLTPFCTALTGIAQDDVAVALPFPAAAARLAAFGAGALFCSWGAYDKNQLARDAARHGIPAPLGPDHANVKDAFASVMGTRRLGTREALERAGMTFTGTRHRGLDDARNVARLLPVVLGRRAA